MSLKGSYPYQAQVTGYGDMGFRFADMSHRGSLLCLPTGMFSWDVTDASQIDIATLSGALEVADQLDVLLVGMGHDISAFPKDVRQAFREKGVIIEATATGPAVRTYNVLFGEDRLVGAAFIAVDRDGRS